MELPSHELRAFTIVAQLLNFSVAAQRIHITQSALSQRIQSLERKLGLTLLVRDRKGIKLTEAGLRLLRYAQAKNHLEAELLSDLAAGSDGKLGGHLRVAGYSSVLHSVIIPALAPLLRDNPNIQFEFSMHEMDQLPGVLMRGEADFVVMDHKHQKNNVTFHLLGHEHYVLIQSNQHPVSNTYLDHDPDDNMTKLFFIKQGEQNQDLSRSYVDNIDGVLNGVVHGLGQGIVPCHLLRDNLPVRIVQTVKHVNMPVVLHYFQQPYYTALQKIAIKTLKDNSIKYLDGTFNMK